MRHAYKSKYNLNRENQIILLMTENKLKNIKMYVKIMIIAM